MKICFHFLEPIQTIEDASLEMTQPSFQLLCLNVYKHRSPDPPQVYCGVCTLSRHHWPFETSILLRTAVFGLSPITRVEHQRISTHRFSILCCSSIVWVMLPCSGIAQLHAATLIITR